jgi:hypothetical protein
MGFMKEREFSRLLSALVDGRLTSTEREQLERILESEAEARLLYMKYIELEVELGSALVVPRATTRRQSAIVPLFLKWAAAALLVFGVFLAAFLMKRPVAREQPKPGGDTWVSDFENASTEGWVGRWTTNDLPTGSRGALSSVTVTNTYGVFHEIRAPERWDTGYFTIHEDTHLHFVYRVETRAWFDIFLAARRVDSREPGFVLHIFRDQRLWSETGRWRRASIPLSLFKRKVDERFANVPPVPGEAPVHFFFSAEQNGLELSIDRIWVTRGGPGKLEIEEID